MSWISRAGIGPLGQMGGLGSLHLGSFHVGQLEVGLFRPQRGLLMVVPSRKPPTATSPYAASAAGLATTVASTVATTASPVKKPALAEEETRPH